MTPRPSPTGVEYVLGLLVRQRGDQVLNQVGFSAWVAVIDGVNITVDEQQRLDGRAGIHRKDNKHKRGRCASTLYCDR